MQWRKIAWASLVILFAVWISGLSFCATSSGKVNPTWLPANVQRPNSADEFEMKWKKFHHSLPDKRARGKITDVVDRLLSKYNDPQPAEIQKIAATLVGTGYQLSEYNGPKGHWLILEGEGKRRGAGYYLFRLGPLPNEMVLQAPHAIFDVHTDVIAKYIFVNYPVRAVFFCDWQRYGWTGKQPNKDSDYDLAHNPDTLYQDLTALWAKRLPQTVFVQIHGFNQSSIRDHDTKMILSPGHRRKVGKYFDKMVTAFYQHFSPKQIALYPSTIKVLGGTTNVQGKLIRKLGGQFIHIELSESVRNEMKKQPKSISTLGQALMAGLK